MDYWQKMICGRCKKTVPTSDIKYTIVSGATLALCSECRSKMEGDMSARPTGPAGPKESTTQPRPKEKPSVAYLCERCRYNFKFRHDGITVLRCPYCGKKDQLVRKGDTEADRMLKSMLK